MQFVCKVEDAVPKELIGDASRLSQILINLVGNALKFTSQGSITLIVRQISSGSAVLINRRPSSLSIMEDRQNNVIQASSYTNHEPPPILPNDIPLTPITTTTTTTTTTSVTSPPVPIILPSSSTSSTPSNTMKRTPSISRPTGITLQFCVKDTGIGIVYCSSLLMNNNVILFIRDIGRGST